jgi:hypothetical protein
MPAEFTKCAQCGIIFPNPDGQRELCPRCANEPLEHEESLREVLRRLKNLLRDAQANGTFLTMEQLAQQANTDESRIWHFIQSGEIDTATLSDPEVKTFLARRHKERLKASVTQPKQPAPGSGRPAAEDKGKPGTSNKASGFHIRREDD